jgi:peptide/nickel transport system substrate-binding protein
MTITRRAALATLAIAGCARVSRRDDAIELVIPNDPATIDPRFVSDVYGLRVARLCHMALVAPHRDTAAPTPWLASTIDDEPDGAVVVTLRDDAYFHDGSRVSAADVVATFRAVGDPALGSPSKRIVAELQTIEALDERRVRFRPKSPRATLRGDLDVAILKASEARAPRDALLTGSGPFRAMRKGWIELTGKRTVIVRTVRDEPARALRIVAGSVDVASNVLTPALAFGLPSRSDAVAGLHVERRAAAATTFLAIQCARIPDPEVRRAIALAIDRATIVSAKLAGAAQLAEGLLPPTIALAPRDRKPFAYDATAAKSVLGKKNLKLTLVTSTDRTRIGIARAIAQALTDAGASTEVRTYEFGTFFARLSAGDFDLAPLIASEISDPDVLRWYLHSDAIPPRGANRARIRDARIDALLDDGLRTMDVEKRRSVYEELESVLREQMPYVPLWHEDHVAVTSARARAFRPSVDGRWGALAEIT